MPIGDEAINVFMGMPGEGDVLELTYNHGVDSYEHGTGYNHIALLVDDLDGTLEGLAGEGHRARKAPLPPRRPHRGPPDLLRPRPRRLPGRADRVAHSAEQMFEWLLNIAAVGSRKRWASTRINSESRI